MQTIAQPAAFTATGRVLSGLAVLFLAFDSLGKLVQAPPVIEGTRYMTTVGAEEVDLRELTPADCRLQAAIVVPPA